jgi:hypothetical protein
MPGRESLPDDSPKTNDLAQLAEHQVLPFDGSDH